MNPITPQHAYAVTRAVTVKSAKELFAKPLDRDIVREVEEIAWYGEYSVQATVAETDRSLYSFIRPILDKYALHHDDRQPAHVESLDRGILLPQRTSTLPS